MPESPVSLTQLIAMVRRVAEGDDPIAHLSTAVKLATDLEKTGDELVGHFVEQARAAGLSWAQIGAALGVSKQAAQQRFVARPALSLGDMSRFTPRAKTVVELARRRAVELQHSFVGTEHLLLGLFDEGEGLAAKAVESLGVTRSEATAAAMARITPGKASGEGESSVTIDGVEGLPFTPRALNALELALREALRLGHNYIGTEHLLLGLASGEGVAADVLRDLDLQLDELRAQVVALLSGYSARKRRREQR